MYSHADIVALLAEGKSVVQVADLVGCTTRTVQRHKQRAGLSTTVRRVRFSSADLDRVQAMIADDAPVTEIAKTLGVSRRTIVRRFGHTGWTKQQAAKFGHELRQLQAG